MSPSADRSNQSLNLDQHIESLYQQLEYLEAYRQHTDIRVSLDPQEAVGGQWEEIGQLQFNFLVRHGLRPWHRLLDIGCGTLRGGRHAIKYLEAGCYTGLDISPKAIEFARQFVRQEGLAEKRPRLLLSENKNLKFGQFAGETFHFILAQSVFTHLPAEHVEECFAHLERIMNDDSTFYFTFKESPRFKRTGLKGFHYPLSFFQESAVAVRLNLVDHSADYPHPKGQKMLAVSLDTSRQTAKRSLPNTTA